MMRNVNLAELDRAVSEARADGESGDRVWLCMSSFTLGFWHHDLTHFLAAHPNVETKHSAVLRAGMVETINVTSDPRGRRRRQYDCCTQVSEQIHRGGTESTENGRTEPPT